MKTVYSIILTLCFSLVCKAQKDWKKVSDSIAMINRAKADLVLKQFDTIHAPKLLYSIEDRYFYVIIKDTPCYKEYYAALDSLGNLRNVHRVKSEIQTRKQKKQQKQYRELIQKAEPIFDLSKYRQDLITLIPDAKVLSGRPSYFVIKDTNKKRYGEYSLPSLTAPLPINTSLWVYLVRRLSDEIAIDSKTAQ